jgi:hypothetical protein
MSQQPPSREELARLEALAASLACDPSETTADLLRVLRDAIEWYRSCLSRHERLLSP